MLGAIHKRRWTGSKKPYIQAGSTRKQNLRILATSQGKHTGSNISQTLLYLGTLSLTNSSQITFLFMEFG